MKLLSTIILMLIFSTTGFSQPASGMITGIVKNSKNEVITAVTVTLLKASDSALVYSTRTDEDGQYQFTRVASGAYLLRVTAIGFNQYTGMPVSFNEKHGNVILPPIIMGPSSTVAMAEVIVKAKRPLIEQEIDKTVVNVASMISSAAGNTLEVLEKTPGVTVNAGGDISLNGRGSILLLIDGRPTYLSGQDLAAYLKSLPGSLLDKIELMDNPPARYDASGNGIINIRLKKNRNAGITGSLSTGYTQGRYGRNNDAANISYNRKKLNFSSSLSYNREKNYTDDRYKRLFYNAGNQLTSMLSLLNRQQNKGYGLNAGAGIDYSASTSTSVGFQFNLIQSNRRGLLGYSSDNYGANGQHVSYGKGLNKSTDSKINPGAAINFLHRFGKTGKELSADINYLKYHTNADMALQNDLYQPDGTPVSNGRFLYLLPSGITIYTFRADYVHPIKNQAKLEAGIKSSVVDNNSIADYYSVTGDTRTIDYRRSNHFVYHENINAAYVNATKSWKRFGTQLGLRIENTQSNGNQLGNDSVPASRQAKNYTWLFPGLYLNYKLDSTGKNSLNLSITRRINRPNYQYLNPFVFFRDNYSYTAGNPLLNPQYQYRYELRYQHKQFLRMALSYNRFTDVIFQTTEAVNELFITRPQNIAKGYMLLLNTGLSLSLASWWNLNADILLSHMGLKGKAYSEDLTPDAYVARINVLNQWGFSNGWSAELGGYYASIDLNGQAFTSGMYRINAGMQKKILKDRGSLRLSVDDLFHSWVYHNRSVSVKQAQYFQVSESDTQRAGIAFTYRFGRDDNAKKRRHTDNAADEEKGRVN
ncbi:MAG: outer membrane beta-barrel protein [Williamsia sp.]|nr:outer membrane beta-barrel protein [Williamsia sp.]